MEDIKTVGLRIREIRKFKKLSQEELACETGINCRTILRIENGHTIPTLETLVKISHALDCDITDFFVVEHLKSRDEILSAIYDKLKFVSDDDLKKVYLSFRFL
mgnify:CR=1 FL=1